MYFGLIDTITICYWSTVFIKTLPIALPAVLFVALLWKEWRKKVLYKLTKKTSLLKVTYVVVSSIIGFALIVLFSLLYAQIISIQCGATQTELNVQNLALAFLGTVSGLAALFGVFLAIQRTDESKRQTKAAEREATTAEQGLITDRINKAVEGLGKNENGDPVIEVRLGSLYALERIAQDSIRDHMQIMEIICAYVRYNSPLPNKTDTAEVPLPNKMGITKDPMRNTGVKARRSKDEGDAIDADIQTALTIIGRRDTWPEGKRRIQIESKHSEALNLSRCNLCRASFNNANLENVWFSGTDLRHAFFIKTKMRGVSIHRANMSNVLIRGTVMTRVGFDKTITENMLAHNINLSKCEYLTQEQIDMMFCEAKTKLPDGLNTPQHWPAYGKYRDFESFVAIYTKWLLT